MDAASKFIRFTCGTGLGCSLQTTSAERGLCSGKGVCIRALGYMGVHGCGYSIAHFMGVVEGCVRACLCGCACVHML